MLYGLILDGRDVDVHTLMVQLKQKNHTYPQLGTIRKQQNKVDIGSIDVDPILEGDEIFDLANSFFLMHVWGIRKM
jgi:hypothetical protein